MSHGTPLSPETHPRCSMLPYLNNHKRNGNTWKIWKCSLPALPLARKFAPLSQTQPVAFLFCETLRSKPCRKTNRETYVNSSCFCNKLNHKNGARKVSIVPAALQSRVAHQLSSKRPTHRVGMDPAQLCA